MYRRLALLMTGITTSLSLSFAQQIDPEAYGYYQDALKFSQFQPFGTARFMGMGGVNTALGADLSSLAGNPAGLGVYNKSEIGLSLGMGFATPSSTYFNSEVSNNRSYVYVPSFGVVFTGDRTRQREGGFKGGSFGIGYSRILNFQNEVVYSGKNNRNSMTDYFRQIANGISDFTLYDLNPEELIYDEELAYKTYLISPYDTTSNVPSYSYYTFNKGYTSQQEETILTRGAINQWNFTYGANFNDKVFIGASLGLPQVRYNLDGSYKEKVLNNDTINYFRYDNTLQVKGSGINFKLGMIAKPADWIRFGLSFQTPTYFTLNQTKDVSLTAVFNVDEISDKYGVSTLDNRTAQAQSMTQVLKYNLYSPMRLGAGVALFYGKLGFISADVEFVPYNQMSLKENGANSNTGGITFIGDNKTIKSLYSSAMNVNIGGELRKDIYRFRLGFSRQGNPYQTTDGVDRSTVNFTGGAGIRLEKYYMDIAVVNSRSKITYYPYVLFDQASPVVSINNKNTSVILSAGIYF